MKKRNLSAPLMLSLLALPGTLTLAPAARAQEGATQSANAYVLAVRGQIITLSVGANSNARVGEVYQIARENKVVRLQLTEVRAAESSARIIAAETGGDSLTITVGDSATRLQGAVPTVQPPTAPPTDPAPVAPPAQPLPPEQPPMNVAPSTDADAEAPPATALVTAVEGKNITLGAGTNRGMKLGAVYTMPATGGEQLRMIVVEVSRDSALARVQTINDGFIPVVGENARFDRIETVPAELLRPAQPIAPVVVAPTQPTVVVPDTPANDARTSVKLASSQSGEISGRAAAIIAVNGESVTLNAGTIQGAKVGQNVPILRNGSVIALVRIESVESDTALASVVYSDATQGSIRVGDAAGLIAPSSGTQAPITLPALGIPNAPVPSVRVKFESGASNVVVPKADATYELLASLAARGLIKSQPARVFQDDGARRHRVAEDIVFSRAQVAGFVTEALTNFDGEKGREAAALSILVKQYRRDLQDLNVPTETLDAFNEGGLQLGISSWTRLTAAGGDNGDASRDANDERFGAFRRKSGLDTRTNFFGTITPKLSFYASLDAGSGIRNGEPFGEVASNSFRKAYLDYDAGSLLRGLNIRLGRQEYWWGPGHFGTGILSDAAGGLDSLSTSFRRGSYEVRGMYARLGTGPAGGPRALYAQDVNVRIGSSAKIGVNTSVLSPNDSFNLTDFVTTFAALPLYYNRKDVSSGNNTNAVVSAYGELAVAQGARVYGELILDDLGTTQNNPIENRAGSVFGIGLKNRNDPTRAGLNFEYARFNSVAYTNFLNRPNFTADYDYYFRGAPLGYSIAPVRPTQFGGAENLRFDGYYRALPRLTLFGSLQYADLNAQDQSVPGPRGFQRQRVTRFAATYDLTSRFALTARYQNVATDNPNFIKNEGTRKDSVFSLEIGRSF